MVTVISTVLVVQSSKKLINSIRDCVQTHIILHISFFSDKEINVIIQ